jgi:hypothetical protein
MRSFFSLVLCLWAAWTAATALAAEPAPFDLVGPQLQITVAHGGQTLPISQTPNLAPGDQVSIKLDLPPGEAVHYLLVAAVLRGATNPPPSNWFYRDETWRHKGRDGLKITVPADALQMLVFLAPETGGDFKTLVGAVSGRPGAFVRASQDLNQAYLDRSRLDAFLAAIRRHGGDEPDHLKEVSTLLARSLKIKLDPNCFLKTADLQAACLMQGQNALILDDGHSESMVQALTSGASVDLVQQLSGAPQAGYGYYSPYVGAVIDIARLMDSFHTAQYQYIPALATADGDHLNLLLNTPPSFHNPLSVIVVALPAVEAPRPPPLQAVDPKEVFCAQRPDLILPIDGAPLVFSTGYARSMVLHLQGQAVAGKPAVTLDAPVRADAEKGGLVVDTQGLDLASLGPTPKGVLHGYWGFSPFDGPEFRLESTTPAGWTLVADDQQALVVGRDDVVRFQGDGAACVEGVILKAPSGDALNAEWKRTHAGELSVTLPLKAVEPGDVTLLVKQYGEKDVDAVPLKAFAQAGRLDDFEVHAGDATGLLKGNRLDEVASLNLGGVAFTPGPLASAGGSDELTLAAAAADAEKFKTGQTKTAKVVFKDGRTVALKVKIGPPRPKVALVDKSVQPASPDTPHPIRLIDKDEAPQNAQLTFSLRAQSPPKFSGHEQVQVATADGGASATLTSVNGLVFEDAQILVATLDPAKALGASGYGPLRYRIVEDGVAGDWEPLATLVRLPVLKGLKCSSSPEPSCELSGSNLFLIDAVSRRPDFDRAVQVPEGFAGYTLAVPHPTAGRLYLKLHDDPSVINVMEVSGEERSARAGEARHTPAPVEAPATAPATAATPIPTPLSSSPTLPSKTASPASVPPG